VRQAEINTAYNLIGNMWEFIIQSLTICIAEYKKYRVKKLYSTLRNNYPKAKITIEVYPERAVSCKSLNRSTSSRQAFVA
jgi:hypothetical protein